jgi:hypothetical protein
MFHDLILPTGGKTGTAVVFMMAFILIARIVFVVDMSFEGGFVVAYEAANISFTAIVLLLFFVFLPGIWLSS